MEARVESTGPHLVDEPAVAAVDATYFSGDAPPARATVAVTGLPKDALVEIDCIAALRP